MRWIKPWGGLRGTWGYKGYPLVGTFGGNNGRDESGLSLSKSDPQGFYGIKVIQLHA